MSVGLWEGFEVAARHWVWLGLAVCLAGTMWLLWRETRLQQGERRRNMRVREELEAYVQLDARMSGDGGMVELARRVCRLVREKSTFHRVAMMTRSAKGLLVVTGSAGVDEQTLAALRTWGEQVTEAEKSGKPGCRRGDGGLGTRVGRKSFAVVLGKGPVADGCGRAIVMPMLTTGGRVLGAIVVCADRILSVRRSAAAEAITALEMLAAKLGRSMENAGLAERLLQVEKLAGLGLLAGEMSHALNNPLTAVLGFAELIAHTTTEARVQADAERIVREAKRMRETLESLVNYWQPATEIDEEVEVSAVLRELAATCAAKLEERGVQLVVQVGEDLPVVRGNRERLRQVMEHLLNNAAQAVGSAQEMGVMYPLGEEGGRHSIRVTASCDDRALHLMVSDTGPGFREPARVFDPFYGMMPGEEAGMGLSLCYGIVREHGGEISAFNLHPHGAAVMVELPVDRRAARSLAGATREVA
ncbi:MAG: HAMP domain-containing sensor histidine kinase [Edaphobacter sp.]